MRASCSQVAMAVLAGAWLLPGSISAEDLHFAKLLSWSDAAQDQSLTEPIVRSESLPGGDWYEATHSHAYVGCCRNSPCRSGWYADLQLNFLRFHFLEDAAVLQKLSEQYSFSPRFIVGYEGIYGHGARIRYWHFSDDMRRLGAAPGSAPFRAEMNVLDLEATKSIRGINTRAVVSGGVRLADADLSLPPVNDGSQSDLLGLTAAIEMETLLCRDCCRQWSWFYGARISILGGDWGGPTFAVLPTSRDDNLSVTELFTGIEHGCQWCGYEIGSRLGLEIQNWHGDALAAPRDSLGFVGPGVLLHMAF